MRDCCARALRCVFCRRSADLAYCLGVFSFCRMLIHEFERLVGFTRRLFADDVGSEILKTGVQVSRCLLFLLFTAKYPYGLRVPWVEDGVDVVHLQKAAPRGCGIVGWTRSLDGGWREESAGRGFPR